MIIQKKKKEFYCSNLKAQKYTENKIADWYMISRSSGDAFLYTHMHSCFRYQNSRKKTIDIGDCGRNVTLMSENCGKKSRNPIFPFISLRKEENMSF